VGFEPTGIAKVLVFEAHLQYLHLQTLLGYDSPSACWLEGKNASSCLHVNENSPLREYLRNDSTNKKYDERKKDTFI